MGFLKDLIKQTFTPAEYYSDKAKEANQQRIDYTLAQNQSSNNSSSSSNSKDTDESTGSNTTLYIVLGLFLVVVIGLVIWFKTKK